MARRAANPVTEQEAGADLVEAIAEFYDNPLDFVCFVFPWGEEGTALHDQEGPDVWQATVLAKIGELIRERAMEPGEAIRLAVASGHGIGKSALVAWIILWFMATRDNPQVVVTANTASQLTGKTWRELAKWHRLAINSSWFQWTATKFYYKGAPDTWFATAQPWTKERAEAFAGTHDKHVLMLFDEASAIADEIWEVAEGAMTTQGAMWICFGNPTRNTGRFRECWRRFRHRWFTLQVDSREAKMAHKPQLKAWVDDYGEDSDFVRVRVKGEFPRAATTQFISEDDVDRAFARFRQMTEAKRQRGIGHNSAAFELEPDDVLNRFAPLILSVDVARFGDDESVIGWRRGNLFRVRSRHRGLDTVALVAQVALAIQDLQPDAVFVDEAGLGAGVVDQLRALGFDVIGVNGAHKALDERAYYNRRAEMWGLMRLWLRKEGAIEPEQQLKDDLMSPEFGFARDNSVQLETKDDMKARGLPSPDIADCLSMTFYLPVAPKQDAPLHDRLMAQLTTKRPGSWMAH